MIDGERATRGCEVYRVELTLLYALEEELLNVGVREVMRAASDLGIERCNPGSCLPKQGGQGERVFIRPAEDDEDVNG